MPFLGNTPANTFVSIAKQTITGNGGTTYTLSYPVTNANEIDVIYNNVRQEPTAAYTASGTTITFTEAITSTDSVYVIFNGQAVGTIDAPAGAYLPTTGGTVNGQVIVNNKIQIQQDAASNNRLILRGTSGSSYRWNVDNFGSSNNFRIFRENDSDASSGMVVAQIDSSGRLTTPNQPAFMARKYNGGSTAIAQNNVVTYDEATYNIGSCLNTSTGRFTAPIAGKYVFFWSNIGGSTTTVHRTWIRKNGSDNWGAGYKFESRNYTTQAYPYGSNQVVVTLAVADYVDIYYAADAGSSYLYADTTDGPMFSGYLLG